MLLRSWLLLLLGHLLMTLCSKKVTKVENERLETSVLDVLDFSYRITDLGCILCNSKTPLYSSLKRIFKV